MKEVEKCFKHDARDHLSKVKKTGKTNNITLNPSCHSCKKMVTEYTPGKIAMVTRTGKTPVNLDKMCLVASFSGKMSR